MTKFTVDYFREKDHKYLDKLKHERHEKHDDKHALYLLLKEVHNKTKEACTKIESDLCLPPIKSEDFVTGISDGESEYQYELGRRDGYDEGIIAHINKCKNI